MSCVLLVATVQSHIGQFHKPLMRMLKDEGWEIHVAARDNLKEKDTLQLEYPDQVFDIPFQRSPFDSRNIQAYRQLKKILQTNHYDVIHCNTPVGGILTRLASRKYRKRGTKLYYTAHGFHFFKGGSWKNWAIYYPLEKFFSRFTDKLITVNWEDYELAKSKFSCPVYHIHGVGANSEKYRIIDKATQLKLKIELGLQGHILITVGELLPNKNQRTAIAALKRVLVSYPDSTLLIAGNGSERKNLEKYAQDEGIIERVSFLGYTRQLQRYLAASDAEIACSYREGLPLNVIEAMLCGKPVIASKNRGHREMIQEGINGFLVDANDADGFARAICRIFSNMVFDSEIIRNSIKEYTDRYVIQELKAIYFGEENNQ